MFLLKNRLIFSRKNSLLFFHYKEKNAFSVFRERSQGNIFQLEILIKCAFTLNFNLLAYLFYSKSFLIQKSCFFYFLLGFRIQPLRSSEFLSSFPGCFPSFPGTFHDDIPFKFCKCSKNMHGKFSHIIGRINVILH